MEEYQKHNSLSRRSFNTVVYKDFRFHPHFHKNIEFVYVIGGEVTVTVDLNTEKVGKGHFVVIPPMSVHSFETEQHSSVWVGVFSNDHVSEFCSFISNKVCQKLSFRASDPDHTERMLRVIDSGNDFVIKGFLYSVCGELVAKCRFDDADPKKSDIFNRAMRYVADNYLSDITLESMAKALSYEPHYLSRCIHEHTGENFRRLVNGYRVELAKELLTKGGLTVSEIAMRCGFTSIRNFNRVFKAMTDREPKAYASGEK